MKRRNTIELGAARVLGTALMMVLVMLAGCASEDAPEGDGDQGVGATGASGASGPSGSGGEELGGQGGMDVGPCGEDCSAIQAPMCLKAVCNEGQYQGQIGACVVV